MTDLTKYEAQIAEIMAQVPANPFIVDLVGRAIQVYADNVEDHDAISNRLATLSKVAKYVGEVSNKNFYKHHLLMAAALTGLAPETYEILDGPTKTITNATELLTATYSNNDNSFKKRWAAVSKVMQADIDLLVVLLIMYTDDIAVAQKQGEDLVLKSLGYIEANLRKTANITNTMYPYYNAFLAAVNKADF